MSEGRLRKWLLSIAAFLRTQNGTVAEAVSLWKRNVDKEFEGEAGLQSHHLPASQPARHSVRALIARDCTAVCVWMPQCYGFELVKCAGAPRTPAPPHPINSS